MTGFMFGEDINAIRISVSAHMHCSQMPQHTARACTATVRSAGDGIQEPVEAAWAAQAPTYHSANFCACCA